MADEPEKAAVRNDMKTLYEISKKLAGKYTDLRDTVKDKDGNTVHGTEFKLHRWAEHLRNC